MPLCPESTRLDAALAFQAPQYAPRILIQVAFPNNRHIPTQPAQRFDVPLVSFHVACDFLLPELPIRVRQLAFMATMTVPKAAMHENDMLESGQHNVWVAR
jgi:hypothetical protein